jgi:phosphatidylethanolamine-binding protein (PEBP) family uncharacterized protein
MYQKTTGLVRLSQLGMCTVLLSACGGGGVSSSSNNTGNQTPVGSATITVTSDSAAGGLIVASNSNLNSTYTCPADTSYANPQISWTQGPAGTSAYVVIIDEPDVVATNLSQAVHWLVRTDANSTRSIAANQTNLGVINQSASTVRILSNVYVPPYDVDNIPHTYWVRVYAMNANWLPNATGATSPVADFSDANLPTLTSPTAAQVNYYGGDPVNGFEAAFQSYILGKGSVSGTYQPTTTTSC